MAISPSGLALSDGLKKSAACSKASADLVSLRPVAHTMLCRKSGSPASHFLGVGGSGPATPERDISECRMASHREQLEDDNGRKVEDLVPVLPVLMHW